MKSHSRLARIKSFLCVCVCSISIPFSNRIGIRKTKQGRFDTDYEDSRSLNSHRVLIDIAKQIGSRKFSKLFSARLN